MQAGQDKAPFRTREEVDDIVRRGGLSDDEEIALWESLYLTQQEIGEILAMVEGKAKHDFTHPMFALAAYQVSNAD